MKPEKDGIKKDENIDEATKTDELEQAEETEAVKEMEEPENYGEPQRAEADEEVEQSETDEKSESIDEAEAFAGGGNPVENQSAGELDAIAAIEIAKLASAIFEEAELENAQCGAEESEPYAAEEPEPVQAEDESEENQLMAALDAIASFEVSQLAHDVVKEATGAVESTEDISEPENLADEIEETSEPEDLADEIEEISEPENLADEIEEVSEPEDLADEIEEISEPENLADEIEEVSKPDDLVDEIEEISEPDDLVDETEEISEPDDIADEIEETSEPDDLVDEIEEVSEPDDLVDEIEETSEPDDLVDEIEEVSEYEEAFDEIEETSEPDDLVDETEEISEYEEAFDEIEETSEYEEVFDEIGETSEYEEVFDEIEEISEPEDLADEIEETSKYEEAFDEIEETPKKRKKGSTLRKILIALAALIAIVMLVFAAGYGVFAHYYNKLNHQALKDKYDIVSQIDLDDDYDENAKNSSAEDIANLDQYVLANLVEGTEELKFDDDNVTNILLIGTDNRGNSSKKSRSDSMIIASINRNTKKIVMTSVMRDTYVNIPGVGNNRINAAYAYGGPELLISTIEKNFKIPLDKYVQVDFYSFMDIVDAAGGVTLNVNAAEIGVMNKIYIPELNEHLGLYKDLDKIKESDAGVLNLNGKQAVAYSRIRYVGNADFGRTERQRKVLTEIFKSAKSMSVGELNNFANVSLPNITTNLTQGEVLSLIINSPEYLTYDLVSARMPLDGSYKYMTVNKMSVLGVDFAKNRSYWYKNVYGSGE